jgi:hypothetical protein
VEGREAERISGAVVSANFFQVIGLAPEIGRAFGGKHHTTVIHSISKIEQMRHRDPDLNRLLHNLMDSLQ